MTASYKIVDHTYDVIVVGAGGSGPRELRPRQGKTPGRRLDLEAGGRRPAAFICESMLGCGGQIVRTIRITRLERDRAHALGS